MTSSSLAFIVVVILALAADASCEGHQRSRREDAGDFVCPELNGMFADPKTCRRFFQCVNNFAYVSRCPSGLYFDDIQKFCTFKDEARCGPIATTPAPVVAPEDLAPKCNTSLCALPNCFCSSDGTAIPGDLDPKETPQMILISMDDSINALNYDGYRAVFANRNNPNGCPIRGTFFVAHEYTNYQMVQQLHYEGHEIASYAITHRRNFDELDYNGWVQEEVGEREILKNLANIPKDDVLGMRAPHLKPGYNTQFEVLTDYGYVWDSSAAVPPGKVPVWPYTLDYAIPHECRSGTCPTRSFPGIWEFPINSHYVDEYDGGFCPYLDQCVLHNTDANDVLDWLKEDFSRSYDQNRAPYSMAFHTSWFQQKNLVTGLSRFIDWLLEKPDVWFVTNTQALLWITDPTPQQQMSKYQAWDCTQRVVPPKPCNNPVSCAVPLVQNNITDVRYLSTCASCPKVYPWLGDARGVGNGVPDVYKSDNPSL